MDLMQLFGYEELTGVVARFEFPELQLANNVPSDPIDGDIATWQVEKPDIEVYDYFQGRSGVAQPLRQTDYYEKTFSIPYRFTSKSFDGGSLNQYERFGTKEYDSNPLVTRVDSELKKMDWKVGAYTDEYLVSQALQGSITIRLGTAGATVNRTIDYEIPAGNKFTNEIAWSSASTAKPLNDFQVAKDIAAEFGVVLTQALMNPKTAVTLGRTTEVKDYIERYTAGARHLETGQLPGILGIAPKLVQNRYASVGQTDGFKNKIIPDNKVIFLPDWPSGPRDWIEMQQAEFWVPNDMQNGFNRSVGGSATWSRTTDSPTGLTVYHKIARFPVMRKPWVIVILTTG